MRAYTNAPMLVREDFVDTEDLDGVFSGYDPETGTYDTSSWEYRGMHVEAATGPARRPDHRRRRPRGHGPGCTSTSAGRSPAPAAPRSPPTRSATTPCSTRGACSRCCAGTTRATPRSWCTRSAASRRSCSAQVADALTRNSGPGAHQRVLLRRGLDPPHGGRPVHPGRVDPAGAAGQHRPARRRHPGAARARQHPGLHRHPDPVRHAARLHPDAARPPRAGPATRSSRPTPGDKGFWGNLDAYVVSLLKAWFGDAATAGQRLLLRPPAPAHRRPLHVPHRAGPDRRRRPGLLRDRREPGGGHGQRPPAAGRAGQPGMAGGARPAHDRDGHVLEGRPGDRDR